MDWASVLAVTIFFVGIGAGGFLVARSPTFWIGLATELIKRALPFILKRMPPEEEKKWRDEYLRGGRDRSHD